MLKTFLNKFFSSFKNDREIEKLQTLIKDLKWSQLNEFKVSCHNTQVCDHYQAQQSWHYEWSSTEQEKFHLTVYQPESSPKDLVVKGYLNDLSIIQIILPLEEDPELINTPFKKRVQKPASENTQKAKEILSNLHQLNGEFAQFIVKDLIDVSEPVKKKEQTKEFRSDETRGLEWIRVSYQLLSQAMNKALSQPEEMRQEWNLQWRQISEEDNLREVRFLAFNLDTLITAQSDRALEVSIYDHQNFKKPVQETSFMGQFGHGTAEFIELFSSLLRDIIS